MGEKIALGFTHIQSKGLIDLEIHRLPVRLSFSSRTNFANAVPRCEAPTPETLLSQSDSDVRLVQHCRARLRCLVISSSISLSERSSDTSAVHPSSSAEVTLSARPQHRLPMRDTPVSKRINVDSETWFSQNKRVLTGDESQMGKMCIVQMYMWRSTCGGPGGRWG